eukprot:gene8672-10289_t
MDRFGLVAKPSNAQPLLMPGAYFPQPGLAQVNPFMQPGLLQGGSLVSGARPALWQSAPALTGGAMNPWGQRMFVPNAPMMLLGRPALMEPARVPPRPGPSPKTSSELRNGARQFSGHLSHAKTESRTRTESSPRDSEEVGAVPEGEPVGSKGPGSSPEKCAGRSKGAEAHLADVQLSKAWRKRCPCGKGNKLYKNCCGRAAFVELPKAQRQRLLKLGGSKVPPSAPTAHLPAPIPDTLPDVSERPSPREVKARLELEASLAAARTVTEADAALQQHASFGKRKRGSGEANMAPRGASEAVVDANVAGEEVVATRGTCEEVVVTRGTGEVVVEERGVGEGFLQVSGKGETAAEACGAAESVVNTRSTGEAAVEAESELEEGEAIYAALGMPSGGYIRGGRNGRAP